MSRRGTRSSAARATWARTSFSAAPARNKHGFWTGPKPEGEADAWLAGATKNEGSWWPHWTGWLNDHGSGKAVPARNIADGIESAPGTYAKMA